MRPKLFSWHCCTHFPKTTAPQPVIFSGTLSTIIIFKLCKFSVNLLTLCFLSYKKYIHPLRQTRCHQMRENSFVWALRTLHSELPSSLYIYCLHLHTFLFTTAPIITSNVFICLVTDDSPLLMTLSWFWFKHLSLALFFLFCCGTEHNSQHSFQSATCFLCWVFLTCLLQHVRGRELNSDWFNVILFSEHGLSHAGNFMSIFKRNYVCRRTKRTCLFFFFLIETIVALNKKKRKTKTYITEN